MTFVRINEEAARDSIATAGTPAMLAAARAIGDMGYDNIRLDIDTVNSTCWCFMDPVEKPSIPTS